MKLETAPAAKAPVLQLSARAQARVQHLLTQDDKGALGMRLSVKKGGCAGMEYAMDYAYERAAGDESVEVAGTTIFIAAPSLLFLLGTVMDYEENKFASGFVFKNPNQTDACGCGESVTLVPQAESPPKEGTRAAKPPSQQKAIKAAKPPSAPAAKDAPAAN